MDQTQSSAYLPAIPNGAPSAPPNSYQSSQQASAAPALSGGLPGAMQALRTIEQGYQMLQEALPSMAQLAAQQINALRTSLPAALQELGQGSADQGQAGPPGMPPSPQPPPGYSDQGQG